MILIPQMYQIIKMIKAMEKRNQHLKFIYHGADPLLWSNHNAIFIIIIYCKVVSSTRLRTSSFIA